MARMEGNSALPSGVVGEAHNNELPREGQGLHGATPAVGFLVQSGGGGRGRVDISGFGSYSHFKMLTTSSPYFKGRLWDGF